MGAGCGHRSINAPMGKQSLTLSVAPIYPIVLKTVCFYSGFLQGGKSECWTARSPAVKSANGHLLPCCYMARRVSESREAAVAAGG